jgi:hypothetical protein
MARMRSILRILRLLCYLAGVEDWLVRSELRVHVLGGCAVLSLSSWHSLASYPLTEHHRHIGPDWGMGRTGKTKKSAYRKLGHNGLELRGRENVRGLQELELGADGGEGAVDLCGVWHCDWRCSVRSG